MMRRYFDRSVLVSLFAAALFLLLPLSALAQDNGGAAGLIGGTIGCLFSLIGLAVWIAVTVWVYRDAQSRGENAILWALLTFFLGLIGLVIWLVVRQNKPKMA